jgi:hypothetical protein
MPGSEDFGVDVVAVSGFRKSGASTVVRMLGELPGVFVGGELKQLFARGVRDGQLCGCGRPFRSCDLWSQVGLRAFGGWDRVDVASLVRTGEELHSARGVASLAARRDRPTVARYGAATAAVFEAIHELTGAHTVVDFSKTPYRAPVVAATVPGARVRWVHTVRDPRSTTYWWMRAPWDRMPKLRPGDRPKSVERAIRQWIGYNAVPPIASRLGRIPYHVVRYEAFTRHPAALFEEVRRFAHLPPPAAPLFLDDRTLLLSESHGIPCRLIAGGKQERYVTGPWRMPDPDPAEWRAEMPLAARVAVTAAASPLLAGFGYLRRTDHALTD